jgi:3-deoxy-D-manno-octulosonate 8-phosphate phosphatase (KDO 8-P phosphatase)
MAGKKRAKEPSGRTGFQPVQDTQVTNLCYQEEAVAPIELLVLDVDGVLTDGGINLDDAGREFKRFNAQDGAGIKYWQRAGKQVAVITGRPGEVIVHRCKELGITHLVRNAKDKLPAYEALLAELKLSPAQAAVMGDDLPDLPIMRRCGLAIAPANAVAEVRGAAGLVTRKTGGDGAVREAIEHLLKRMGFWPGLMERYLR